MAVPIVVEFLAGTAGLSAGLGKVMSELGGLKLSAEASMANVGKVGVAVSGLMVVAAGAVAVASVKMAGDYESAITHLTTDAGEAKSNMGMISDGILQIAQSTGSGTKDLVNAMYYIESSGQHGAQALDTLHAAAEGAKVGNADLTTVADALSTVMSGYGDKAGTATQVTDQLVTAVSLGKTKLEDLAGAMGTVLPVAEKAHIGLSEVLGAMSTMTAQGQDTAKAATYLRQTIAQLSNPTRKAADEMTALGINQFELSNNMGKNGLTGTMDILTTAIANHTEGGAVLIDQLKTSAKSATGFEQVLANLPPTQQTVVAALADMVGGTKSMQAALELTGDQASRFKDNVAKVGESASQTGSHVQDWDVIQGTFNQHMSELKATMEVLAIKIGTALLPAVSKIADAFGKFLNFVADHQWALVALAAVIGGALIVALSALSVALWTIAANPVVLIVAAIVAAVALLAIGIYELWTHWGEIWGWIKDITKVVADFFVDAWNHAFQSVRDALNTVGAFFTSVWSSITGFFSSSWNSMTSATSSAMTAVGNFFRDGWNKVVSVTMTAVHAVGDAISTAWNAITSVTSTVFGAVTGFFAKWWPLLLAIFLPGVFVVIALWNNFHEKVWNIVTTAWNAVVGFLSSVLDTITSTVSDGWNAAYSFTANIVGKVVSFVTDKFNAVVSFLSGVWSSITSAVSTAWDAVYKSTSDVIGTVVSFITDKFNAVVSFLSGVWDSITSATSAGWNAVKSATSTALDALLSAVKAAGGFLYDNLIQPIVDAYNFLTGLVGKFFDIGSNIVNGIIDGVKNAAGGLFGAVSGLLNSALGVATHTIDSHSPSRVFADRVGAPISQGIALGITNSAHHVDSALAGVTKPGSFGLPSFTGGGGPGGTYGATGGGNGAGNHSSGGDVHIHFSGPIYGGPSGMQEVAAIIRTELLKTKARNGGLGLA